MGCKQSRLQSLDTQGLFVATLNYSGIIDCPFEFYCQQYQDQLYDLSRKFFDLIKQYIPDFDKDKFKWTVGKIDKKFRLQRYSPLFSPHAGIEKFQFVNRERFEKQWNIRFQKSGLKDQDYKTQEKDTMRLFDFIFYHAVLSYVYKDKNFETLIKNDTKEYLNFLQPFFKLSFLNQQTKLDKVIKSFEQMNVDAFFFQQYSPYFSKYIQRNDKYQVVVKSNNMIVLRKKAYKLIRPIQQVLSQKIIKQLNWNETVLAFADNIIFICAHLSSKSDKNPIQMKAMESSLAQLRREYPQYDIIMGGDLNAFYNVNKQLISDINVYPKQINQLTSIKMRTTMQVQYQKSQKLVKQSKDKIMTTFNIDKNQITFIDLSHPRQNSFMPTDKHPFDHFVVSAFLTKK